MQERIRIGDKLVQYGYITQEQLKLALLIQKNSNKRIGEVLIDEGIITAELLTKVLTELLNVDKVSLNNITIDSEAILKIPQNICKRYKVFPYKIENKKLFLAMEDPQDREAIQDVKRISGMDIEVRISTISEINQAIDKYYLGNDIHESINEYAKNETIIKDEIIEDDDVNSAPIVRLVHSILESAVRKNASDIHIEYDGDFMRVRFRIDGILLEQMKTSSRAYKAIISRIKIMANLNIAEKRLPQDGRIFLVIDNKSVDFRVSTMPMKKNEKVVMRVLDKSNFMISKEKLGFNNQNRVLYDDLLAAPYGLILVVGPTGSGKTTTLYSMLNQLNSIEKNILTIEDPIEYELQGINQSQINYKAGLDFTSALRAFLRQDPDIIMVGEIRDYDTAEMAIRASLTGHLVLSTLHANTAIGAITRLVNMNIFNFLISSSLVGVVAQRLVRKICPFCKMSYQASSGEKKILNQDLDKELILYKGKGCNECNKTGYKGRIGIYEIIRITSELRELIDNDAKEYELINKAKQIGFKTMQDDASNKVLDGETTLQEMLRITLINN